MNIKLSYHWAVAALLAIATGCSNDNITPETKPDAGKPETTQVSFIAGNEGTRTSLNYGSGDFYWEADDRILWKTMTTLSMPAAMRCRAHKYPTSSS